MSTQGPPCVVPCEYTVLVSLHPCGRGLARDGVNPPLCLLLRDALLMKQCFPGMREAPAFGQQQLKAINHPAVVHALPGPNPKIPGELVRPAEGSYTHGGLGVPHRRS